MTSGEQSFFMAPEFPHMFTLMNSSDVFVRNKNLTYLDYKRLLRAFTTGYLELDISVSPVPDEGEFVFTKGLEKYKGVKFGAGHDAVKSFSIETDKSVVMQCSVADYYMNQNFTGQIYIKANSFNHPPRIKREKDDIFTIDLSSEEDPDECFSIFNEKPAFRKGVIYGAYNECADSFNGYGVTTDGEGCACLSSAVRPMTVLGKESGKWEEPDRQMSLAIRSNSLKIKTKGQKESELLKVKVLFTLGACYGVENSPYLYDFFLVKHYAIS